GRRAKKQREVIDSVAASIILSTYLSMQANLAERARASDPEGSDS
ncbi:MAG: RNase H-fold protein (predicted Holliday junction resolvase), partial [Myxococcota bacterium]